MRTASLEEVLTYGTKLKARAVKRYLQRNPLSADIKAEIEEDDDDEVVIVISRVADGTEVGTYQVVHKPCEYGNLLLVRLDEPGSTGAE